MSTFIKGDVIILSLWNGTDAYEPIACLTSNSLSLTRNVIESQTKCDPGVIIKDAGSFSYSVECEGQAITTEAGKESVNSLITKMNTLSPTIDTWRMDDGNGGYYYGTAWLTATSYDASAGDELATFSTTLDGSGLILTADPEV